MEAATLTILIDIFNALPPNIATPFLIMGGIFFVYLSISNYDKLNKELVHLRAVIFERKMHTVELIVDSVEAAAIKNIRTILTDTVQQTECAQCLTKKPDIEKQIMRYTYVWFDNKISMRNRFKIAIRNNGFHDKVVKELDDYITILTDEILTASRKKIESHSDSFPIITAIPEEKRFDIVNAKLAVEKVILSCISIHKDEVAEEKKIRLKHNIILGSTKKVLLMIVQNISKMLTK